MFSVCHGSSEYGDSFVPSSFQEHINDISIGKGISCALLDSNQVSCWGQNAFAPPGNICPDPVSVHVLQNAVGVQCASNLFLTWTSMSTITSFTSVQKVSVYQDDSYYTCIIQNETASCTNALGVFQPLSNAYTGNVEAITGNSTDGCVKLADANSFSCYGSYMGQEPEWREKTFLQLKAGYGVVCAQWNDGWTCKSDYSNPLHDLWALESSYKIDVIPFYSVDFSDGRACAILKNRKVACIGKGFTSGGDIVDGISSMNIEDTYKSNKIVLSSSQVCALVQNHSTMWAWILFSCFVIFLILGMYVAVRYYKKEELYDTYGILPV